MKDRQEAEIWKKVFSAHGGEEGGLEAWKKKYLYPFGNIAPVPDFDLGAHGDAAAIQHAPKQEAAEGGERSRF